MGSTYQFTDHLRLHRPSRLGQRLWWIPAVTGVGMAIADALYIAATPIAEVSVALAIAGPFVAAVLMLVAWASLSIADWTYLEEQRYRDAHQVATSRALAYIRAGRRTGDQRATTGSEVNPSDLKGERRGPHWVDDFAWTDPMQIRRVKSRVRQR